MENHIAEHQILIDIFKQNNIIPTIILDIGAYDCSDSIKFSEYWPNAKIYAFEPNPEGIAMSKENINNHDNIELIEYAISDIDGYVDWYQSGGGSLGSSSIKKPVDHLILHPTVIFNEKTTIKSIKLDTWVKERNIDVIDLMWCDVQGAEDLLINGAQETLKKTRCFYTEYFDFEVYKNQPSLENMKTRLTNFKLAGVKGNNALFTNIKINTI